MRPDEPLARADHALIQIAPLQQEGEDLAVIAADRVPPRAEKGHIGLAEIAREALEPLPLALAAAVCKRFRRDARKVRVRGIFRSVRGDHGKRRPCGAALRRIGDEGRQRITSLGEIAQRLTAVRACADIRRVERPAAADDRKALRHRQRPGDGIAEKGKIAGVDAPAPDAQRVRILRRERDAPDDLFSREERIDGDIVPVPARTRAEGKLLRQKGGCTVGKKLVGREERLVKGGEPRIRACAELCLVKGLDPGAHRLIRTPGRGVDKIKMQRGEHGEQQRKEDQRIEQHDAAEGTFLFLRHHEPSFGITRKTSGTGRGRNRSVRSLRYAPLYHNSEEVPPSRLHAFSAP